MPSPLLASVLSMALRPLPTTANRRIGPGPADRVFGILRENNPELTGERRRTTLKPPQVAREGTKKTVFTNFMELCKSMNRNHEHVQAFLLAELGTSGEEEKRGGMCVGGGGQGAMSCRAATLLLRACRQAISAPGVWGRVPSSLRRADGQGARLPGSLGRDQGRPRSSHAATPFSAHPVPGSLDGQQRLIVKGRFLPKAFEGVLRRYINECVAALASLGRVHGRRGVAWGAAAKFQGCVAARRSEHRPGQNAGANPPPAGTCCATPASPQTRCWIAMLPRASCSCAANRRAGCFLIGGRFGGWARGWRVGARGRARHVQPGGRRSRLSGAHSLPTAPDVQCGASRTVSAIKAGFQARTVSRKSQMRG